MQQRRLRLGDILDDYCPRERRLTNHVVVAMIDDEVKQTRCSTCDADHEYKQARVPPRKKKDGSALVTDSGASVSRSRSVAPEPDPLAPTDAPMDERIPSQPLDAIEIAGSPDTAESETVEADPVEDDGPVHRRLIRATLPRPEGQVPERKIPEFTARQPSGTRGDGNRPDSGRGRGQMRGQSNSSGQPHRFGGARPGGQRQGAGQSPPGNRSGGGRSGEGQGRGQRQGGGSGRRRGR